MIKSAAPPLATGRGAKRRLLAALLIFILATRCEIIDKIIKWLLSKSIPECCYRATCYLFLLRDSCLAGPGFAAIIDIFKLQLSFWWFVHSIVLCYILLYFWAWMEVLRLNKYRLRKWKVGFWCYLERVLNVYHYLLVWIRKLM